MHSITLKIKIISTGIIIFTNLIQHGSFLQYQPLIVELKSTGSLCYKAQQKQQHNSYEAIDRKRKLNLNYIYTSLGMATLALQVMFLTVFSCGSFHSLALRYGLSNVFTLERCHVYLNLKHEP